MNNITTKKIKDLGFAELCVAFRNDSAAFPVYYEIDSFPGHFLGRTKMGEWGFYKWGEGGQCRELDRVMYDMSEIIWYIINQSVAWGEEKKAREIRAVLGVSKVKM